MTRKFGWVALSGPPNAGKSTLLNRLLGQKLAIVSPKPQTTRTQIRGALTLSGDNPAQVVLIDTPGAHSLSGRMNRYLLDAAYSALDSADVVVAVLDASLFAAKPGKAKAELGPLAKKLQSPLGEGRPLLVALNKIDSLKEKARLLPIISGLAEMWPSAEIYPISALNGQGVDDLLARIVQLLPPGDFQFPEDHLTSLSMRFLASEIIREKLFLTLREELPYQTAVAVDAWEEPEQPQGQTGGLTRILATIYVGKPSHKGIVIGKGGASLRQIGTEARQEIEEMIEGRVFLDLHVKVKEGWTEHPGFLRELGFGAPDDYGSYDRDIPGGPAA